MSITEKYLGNNNSGKPKSEYLEKLSLMTEAELTTQCESKIWLSAYANNNPRSDFHWQVDVCYDECERREKVQIYEQAYKNVSKSVLG